MQADERSRNSAEFEGRSIEEAIEKGLRALGLPREQVDVEVLEAGSRGFLGLGAESARVRLTPTVEKTVKKEETPQEPVEAREAEPPPPEAGEEKPIARDAGISPEEADLAQELLEGLLARLHIRGEVERRYEPPDPGQDTGTLILDIRGRDLSILIGRQAETLRALQYILRLMVSHRLKRWFNVVVDVEGYKQRREGQLRQLAERMAERAVLSGRPVALEPMPPHERRIVHMALREHPKVATQSIGEGDRRRVTIRLREP